MFKKSMDTDILMKLFQDTCIKSDIDNTYIFNNESYKKGIFNEKTYNRWIMRIKCA